MPWGQIVLTGLKLLFAIFGWAKDRQLLKAGEDRAIARGALDLLEKTEEGKRLRERIRALDDKQADDLLDRIGNAP